MVGDAAGEDDPQFLDRKSSDTFWLMLIRAFTSSVERLSMVFWSAWLKTARFLRVSGRDIAQTSHHSGLILQH